MILENVLNISKFFLNFKNVLGSQTMNKNLKNSLVFQRFFVNSKNNPKFQKMFMDIKFLEFLKMFPILKTRHVFPRNSTILKNFLYFRKYSQILKQTMYLKISPNFKIFCIIQYRIWIKEIFMIRNNHKFQIIHDFKKSLWKENERWKQKNKIKNKNGN